jgi:hypothetical protein
MTQVLAQKTLKTPEINLDPSKETIAICGRSYPEDLDAFWSPHVNQLNSEVKNWSAPKITFNLTYHNSGTTRIIINLIREWENLARAGAKVSVDWIFDPEDEQTEEQGNDYSDFCKDVSFKLIALADG